MICGEREEWRLAEREKTNERIKRRGDSWSIEAFGNEERTDDTLVEYLAREKESNIRIYCDCDASGAGEPEKVERITRREMEHVRMMENEEEIRVHEEEWPDEKIQEEEEGLELRKREGAQERPKKKIKRETKRGTG